MKKTLPIILFFCLSSISVFGQLVKTPLNKGLADGVTENISLLTDRIFYLSGEEIWFVAYITVNEKPFVADFSQVLYVELFGSDEKAVVKKKFAVENGIAKGNFTIPEEALSGIYSLNAYTLFLRNSSSENFSTIPISVINPERPLPENSRIALPLVNRNEAETALEIRIKPNKSDYRQRALVELELTTNAPASKDFASISISVVKKGTFNYSDSISMDNSTLQKPNSSENLLWLPEIRDVSISGLIRNKGTNLPEPNTNVYLSVLGQNPQFHVFKSGQNGEFVFSLHNATGQRNVFVCSEPNSEKELELLINNDFEGSFSQEYGHGLPIDTSFKNLIGQMYINHQAGKVFELNDSSVSEKVGQTTLIFGKPTISILLKDFIEMPSLEDVFKELVTAVSIKKKKGKSSFYVLNSETNRMNHCGYVFLDNVLVFDIDALLKVPPSKIERVDVINRTTYYGDFMLDAVILITTNTDNFAGYSFPKESVFLEYQTITPPSDFKTPDYGNENLKFSRLPDFRTLLYWNPEVKLQNGMTTVSFYTSDYCADYDVIVRGIDAKGKKYFGKANLTVVPDSN